jgi:hypothetical protein
LPHNGCSLYAKAVDIISRLCLYEFFSICKVDLKRCAGKKNLPQAADRHWRMGVPFSFGRENCGPKAFSPNLLGPQFPRSFYNQNIYQNIAKIMRKSDRRTPRARAALVLAVINVKKTAASVPLVSSPPRFSSECEKEIF